MPQFAVIAKDGTDSEALNRRMAARGDHFSALEKYKASGNFIKGAALLNANSEMCGSIVFYEFGSREELDQYLKNEPYVLGGVWKDIEVIEIKVAPL